MEPLKIIEKHYDPSSLAYDILVTHSRLVSEKALWLAGRVSHRNPDTEFIREAAWLHDIGIIRTNAPGIGCFGKAPYIQHGVIGSEMLRGEGLKRHALVCERHTGVGITREDVELQLLLLPANRDFVPVSLEEEIICLADKFFSKKPENLRREKDLTQVRKSIAKHGEDKLQKLQEWIQLFDLD